MIGGDCSPLLAAGLAFQRRAGLIHIDGHTDFRHFGNSDNCASIAGEALASADGRHRPAIADTDGREPRYWPADTVHIGCRANDQDANEVQSFLDLVLPALQSIEIGMTETARAARATARNAGYWLQIDVAMLDPTCMPTVDSPDPGGLNPEQLIELLKSLAPEAVGAQVTVFDSDRDSDGHYREVLAERSNRKVDHSESVDVEGHLNRENGDR